MPPRSAMVGTDELSTLLVTSPAGRVLIDGGLRAGRALPSDPQHTEALPFSAVPQSQVFADDDTVRVGPLALVAHLTPEPPSGAPLGVGVPAKALTRPPAVTTSCTPTARPPFPTTPSDTAAADGLTLVDSQAVDVRRHWGDEVYVPYSGQ